MTAVSSIVFIVLLLQIGAITAQRCSRPTCSGSLLDLINCRCSGSVTDSTCPLGTSPIVGPHGLCSCKGTTPPTCRYGFELDSSTCKCNYRQLASCPSGTSLSPTSYCTGSHAPTCRSGTLHGCQCVKEYVRQCRSGTLSNNGCQCRSEGQLPTCSTTGCRLNSQTCSCFRSIQQYVTCYYGTTCSGPGFQVPTGQECCRGTFIGPAPISLSAGYSHDSPNGCVSCLAPH